MKFEKSVWRDSSRCRGPFGGFSSIFVSGEKRGACEHSPRATEDCRRLCLEKTPLAQFSAYEPARVSPLQKRIKSSHVVQNPASPESSSQSRSCYCFDSSMNHNHVSKASGLEQKALKIQYNAIYRLQKQSHQPNKLAQRVNTTKLLNPTFHYYFAMHRPTSPK